MFTYYQKFYTRHRVGTVLGRDYCALRYRPQHNVIEQIL